MKVSAVFVQDDYGKRFIDSVWGRVPAAHNRATQLKETMIAMGYKAHVWVVPMQIEDVEIKEDKKGA